MQLSRYLDLVSVGFTTGEAAQEVDTQGCEGVLFIGVKCSTAARTMSMALKAGASTTSFVTCASTFTHASTAAGSDMVIITDVYKPAKRWIGATLTTTSAVPQCLLALKYTTRKSVGNFTAAGTNTPSASGGIKRAVSPSSAT